MKKLLNRAGVVPALGLLLLMVSTFYAYTTLQRESFESTLPTLPRPIGEERALITSAGQSTDTYLVKDLANGLRIQNFFMPGATAKDLEEIETILVVVGYSDFGERLKSEEMESEIERLELLYAVVEERGLPMITLFPGGAGRRGRETDELLARSIDVSEYVIATIEGDYDGWISDRSEEAGVPLTLVEGVASFSEPLASIFR